MNQSQGHNKSCDTNESQIPALWVKTPNHSMDK
jgi:hypothetical protein